MARRKSPKDSKCKHCGRYFTAGGLRQHLRHVKCSPTSTATPRKFKRVRCRHCGSSFHSTNSLRVHVSTRHAKEYAKSPGSMKDHRAPYKRKDSSKSGEPTGADRKTSPRTKSRSPSSGVPVAPPVDNSGKHKVGSGAPQRKRESIDAPAWQREMGRKMSEVADGQRLQ